jgi:hypothetical protein
MVREKAIEASGAASDAGTKARRGSASSLNKADYFHDGRSLLPEVTRWHTLLRNFVRKTDPLTVQVLNFVDQNMLLGNPEKRMKMVDVCAGLDSLISSSGGQSMPSEMETMMQMLLQIDQDADPTADAEVVLEKPKTKTLGLPVDRKAMKSQITHLPLMKTSHRSQYLASTLAHSVQRPSNTQNTALPTVPAIVTQPPDEGEHLRSSHEEKQVAESQATAEHREDFYADPLRRRGTSFSRYQPTQASSLLRRNSMLVEKGLRPQNVIQAREEIQRRDKGKFIHMKKTKDELLSAYYQKREIVRRLGCRSSSSCFTFLTQDRSFLSTTPFPCSITGMKLSICWKLWS